jgi:subtilisin family serine protease
VVFVFAFSMAAVAIPAPAASTAGADPLNKMGSELRDIVKKSMDNGRNSPVRAIVFLEDGSDLQIAGSEMAKRGAAVKNSYGALGAFAVEMDALSAVNVAGLASVSTILLDEKEYYMPAQIENEIAAAAGYAGSGQEAIAASTDVWWASTAGVMGAEDVWDLGITGAGVRVAVLDTGCDITQNDLKDAIYSYRSFTSEEFHDVDGHGTATAGLVASRGVNDYVVPQFDGVVKMKGMAPGAMVMTGKVLDDTGYGWDSWIIGGIEWAVSGDDGVPGTGDEAQIISMSLGGMEVPNDGDDPTSLALDIAAEDYGVISVLAAGNEGSGASTVGSAGVSKSTITAGASTLNAECQLLKYWPLSDYNEQYLIVKEGEEGYENNHMIWWSSRGPTGDGRIDPDISAAGAWGPSTQPGNTIEMMFGGTSMATPVVAGIVALMYEAYLAEYGVPPTVDYVKEMISSTALDMGYAPNEQGPGRLDALAAVEAVLGGWRAAGQTSIAVTIDAGSSANLEFAAGAVLDSKTTVPSGRDGMYLSGVSVKGVDLFIPFEVASGEDFVKIDLAFDQKMLFSRDVHVLYSTGGYNDNHINLVLYRLDENGERTLINYGYDHANTQELNAKVAPGMYELRVSPVLYTAMNVPYDLSIEFFKTVEWDWFDAETATITVPADARPGVHMAFVMVDYNGIDSLVPVAVNVPVRVGEAFEHFMDVNHGIYGFVEGDWRYYSVFVPEDEPFAALTSVIEWSDYNTDIDQYWISPSGCVIEQSVTPYLGLGMFGPWTTSSGDTADVLTVLNPEPGEWQLATHIVLMGRALVEPYTVSVLPLTAAEFTKERIVVKPGMHVSTTIGNNVDVPVAVGLKAVKTTLATTTTAYAGTVSSVDLGGTGAVEVLFDVAPLTESLTVSIEWFDEAVDFDVVIYGADWSNRGMLWENGDAVVIDDPVCGEWDAAVALKNSALDAEFVLTVTTTYYEPWTDLKLSTYSLMLEPDGEGSFTVSMKGRAQCFKGLIIAYDLVTGCEYDTLKINGKQ